MERQCATQPQPTAAAEMASAEDRKRGRDGSANDYNGFQPHRLGGAREGTTARLGRFLPIRDERFQEPTLSGLPSGYGIGETGTSHELAWRSCAMASDVDAHRRCDRNDNMTHRRRTSSFFCASPCYCCSFRPSLRRAVTALLLRKCVAAEFSGLLRRSLAQYGLAHFQLISRRHEHLLGHRHVITRLMSAAQYTARPERNRRRRVHDASQNAGHRRQEERRFTKLDL